VGVAAAIVSVSPTEGTILFILTYVLLRGIITLVVLVDQMETVAGDGSGT